MDSSQLELFTQETSDSKPRMPLSFRAYVKKFEKAVLLLISFVVISVIAFSLGVEKGKRLSSPESREASINMAFQSAAPVAARSMTIPPVQPAALEKTAAAVSVNAETTQQPQKKVLQNGLVIQIGSFSTKANAQKEASILKKRGFAPIITTKGQYSILCVGAYTSKEAAQASLKKLQKTYPGCFIRRQ